jgi:uncharacterized ubiquitin-like protein YukD
VSYVTKSRTFTKRNIKNSKIIHRYNTSSNQLENKNRFTQAFTRDDQRIVSSFAQFKIDDKYTKSQPRLEGCICVRVECEIEDDFETFDIKVNPTRTIGDLIKVVIMKLGSKYYGIKQEMCKIIKHSRILLDEYTLSECDIRHEETVNMEVLVNDKVQALTDENEENRETRQQNSLIDIEKVKGLNIQGYFTVPEYHEILRMTNSQAQNVKNFTVGNRFGKIVWEGYTNLLTIFEAPRYQYKDISEVVEIEKSALTVYRDDSNKPDIGNGLNKPAIVYLFGIFDKQIKKQLVNAQILTKDEVKIYDNFKSKLREIVRKTGGTFLSFKGHTGEL